MTHLDRPLLLFATALAALAGFVDAYAFSQLGQFFASFMSGNSTRFGAALVDGDLHAARMALALLIAFVAGVIGAVVVSDAAGRHHRAAVMALVTVILMSAALISHSSTVPATAALPLLAMAMGAENGVFNVAPKAQDDDAPAVMGIGVTYFTGTLVRLGQRLARALMQQGSFRTCLRPALLWTGFVLGVLTGALSARAWGPTALWLAAGAALVLAVALYVSEGRTRRIQTVVRERRGP